MYHIFKLLISIGFIIFFTSWIINRCYQFHTFPSRLTKEQTWLFEEKAAFNKNFRNNKERKSFLYYAVPKTASAKIREELRKYCKFRGFRCVMRSDCEVNREGICKQAPPFYDSFSIDCCRKKNSLNRVTAFDGIVDHINLRRAKKEYFESLLPLDSFKFVSLRNPLDHYVSWRNERCEMKMKSHWICKERNISKIIEKEFKDKLLGKQQRSDLANFQSKYLGLHITGNRTKMESFLYNYLFPFIDSLDYIFLTDRMQLSWCHMKHLMNWAPGFFEPDQANKVVHASKGVQLSKESISQLKSLQWVDMELFEYAEKVFEKKFSKLIPKCKPIFYY